jgi:hypothetical protein
MTAPKNQATPILPTWSRRIRPALIRQLYENNAQGLADSVLLDEVGWALVWRCQSFLQAAEAWQHARHTANPRGLAAEHPAQA